MGAAGDCRSLGGRPATDAQPQLSLPKPRRRPPAQLVAFVDETSRAQLPDTRHERDVTVDEAIERFLTEYLGNEKGRAEKTITDYRYLHQKWFSPTIGARPVKAIESSVIDGLFGQMRQAGLSASRLNQAKALYVPFFRWAKRRGMTLRNPMVDFEMPTSTYRSKERTPPEVEELTLLLATAVEVTPDIAPLLVLGAVTGTRRGELVAIPRSAVAWKKNQDHRGHRDNLKGKGQVDQNPSRTNLPCRCRDDRDAATPLRPHGRASPYGWRRTRSRSVSV